MWERPRWGLLGDAVHVEDAVAKVNLLALGGDDTLDERGRGVSGTVEGHDVPGAWGLEQQETFSPTRRSPIWMVFAHRAGGDLIDAHHEGPQQDGDDHGQGDRAEKAQDGGPGTLPSRM